MNRLVVASILMIVCAELVVWSHPDRRVVTWVAGGAAAIALVVVRWYLARDDRPVTDDSRARDPAESLRRWLSRTEILIARADSSRSDWDKYLRPMLARQFELGTGQRRAKDPRAFQATALVLFGEELWPWVDPDNVVTSGPDEPGPGRAVLDEVLQRLEGI